MNDIIDIEARVRLAPAQHRNIYHNNGGERSSGSNKAQIFYLSSRFPKIYPVLAFE
jgi:hypothetical protein